MTHPLTVRALFVYGLMALPVAAAGWPIYVHLPKWYAEQFGLGLAALGGLLLAVRLIDTVQDPLIGLLSDRFVRKGGSRRRLIAYSLPFLALGFLALGYPLAGVSPLLWLAVALVFTYTAFSVVSINYYALGAELDTDYHARSRVSTWREVFVLIGIIFGVSLPLMLGGETEGLPPAMAVLALLCLLLIPLARKGLRKTDTPSEHASTGWKKLLHDRTLRWWIAVVLLNGLANAIPATLILFFIDDVLGAASLSPFFLLAYIGSGLLFAPVWLYLAKRIGKRSSLLCSMTLAAVSFVWAATLNESDVLPFFIICVVSGACLLADMALPPAMLSDISGEETGQAGGYFGIWNVLWKLTFALAAGLIFPFLEWFDYTPGQSNGPASLFILSMAYAVVPFILKTIAILTLIASPLDAEKPQTKRIVS